MVSRMAAQASTQVTTNSRSVPVRAEADQRTIVFFLTDNFSMIAFTAAIEPLRLTSRMSGKQFY